MTAERRPRGAPLNVTTGSGVPSTVRPGVDARALRILVAGLRRVAPGQWRLGCPAGCGPDGHEHGPDRGIVDYSWSGVWVAVDGRPVLCALRDVDADLLALEQAS